MKFKLPPVAEIRKGLVAVAGGIAEVVSLGVLHGTAEHYAEAVLAFLTAVGVYAVPNGVKRPLTAPVVPPPVAPPVL